MLVSTTYLNQQINKLSTFNLSAKVKNNSLHITKTASNAYKYSAIITNTEEGATVTLFNHKPTGEIVKVRTLSSKTAFCQAIRNVIKKVAA